MRSVPDEDAPKPGMPVPRIDIAELVDALLLFDEAILNSRYHGMLARYPHGAIRERLVRLPSLVLESEREARLGAAEWTQLGSSPGREGFLDLGQRTLLESFLSMTENQLRMAAFMSRNAPTARIRGHFDEMANVLHEVARELRDALKRLIGTPSATSPHRTLRSVHEENAEGGLRMRLESALRASFDAGLSVRDVRLSHTALRHLRDEGLFQGQESTVLGVPVVIDLSWETSAFALEGYDVVPLEEILADANGSS